MNIKAKFVDDPKPKQPTPSAATAPVSAAARNLALAHKLDDLIDRGLIADYSAAARLMRVSQPRLTHLMGLRLLCPDLQQAILCEELAFADKELRKLARIADWAEQKAWVAARTAAPRVRRARA